ncbi:endonuclease [bacterium]|nr:endonuclease [bacterium]
MKKIILLIIMTFSFSQDTIGEGLLGDDLIDYLIDNYKTSSVLSYNNARDVLYGEVDKENGQVKAVYTNYSVQLPNGVDPSTHLYENGIDCEHVWPQSMGASQSPMKSDMHHLRPCKTNVNSSRGNSPFGEVNTSQVNHWYWLEYDLSNPPSQNIDEYSESASGLFEPREDMKGDIARSMFYFYTMYSDVANDDFFNVQKEQLYEWHQIDSITPQEIVRTNKISEYQDYPNPFIIDESLIQRCYFEEDFEEEYMMGDVNQDSTINILDIVFLMNYILNLIDLNEEQIALGDLNNDNGINILDIVLLIEEIIS